MPWKKRTTSVSCMVKCHKTQAQSPLSRSRYVLPLRKRRALKDGDGCTLLHAHPRCRPDPRRSLQAGVRRYALPQASSAAKAGRNGHADADPGRPDVPAAASPADSPRQAAQQGGRQLPPLTLAQELHTVLDDLTQQHQALQQQQQQQKKQQRFEEGGGGEGAQPRRGGSRRIMHNSPAVQPLPEPPLEAGAGNRGSRRWRPPDLAAQAQRARQQGPQAQHGLQAQHARHGAPVQDSGAGAFFSVDDDLLQAHAQRQAPKGGASRTKPAAPPHRLRQRTVGWDSPQPVAAAAVEDEHTPLPSQRTNRLAALLDGGGSGSQQPVTTGGRLRGRHPIYGASSTQPRGGNAGNGLPDGKSDDPDTSSRHALGQRRPAQHQHSRLAAHDIAPADSHGGADAVQTGILRSAGSSAAALRLMLGRQPAAAEQKQPFQPRAQRSPSPQDAIEDAVEEDDEEDQQRWQQQQWSNTDQQQTGPGSPAYPADPFRTPGQPLRRLQHGAAAHEGGDSAGQQAAARGMGSTGAAATPATAPGPSHAKSLQRQFIAQLQPVSRPAAAATILAQRQRLAGAAGLHARMQALLAVERAELAAAQSPARRSAGGPRLTVLEKVLEASLTKCHCR